MLNFLPGTLVVSFYFINFINYDLCSGASTFTPFAAGCSVFKKTDLILSCLYVMDFDKYNNRIP